MLPEQHLPVSGSGDLPPNVMAAAQDCGVGYEERDALEAELDESLRKVVQGQRRLAVQQRAIMLLMNKQLALQRQEAASAARGGLSGMVVGHS